VQTGRSFAQELVEVEGLGVHGEIAHGIARPEFLRFVTVKLDSILIGIAKIKRFTDAVIGSSVERNLSREESMQSCGEGGAIGIEDSGVVQTGGARRRRSTAETLPGVDGDVMMIAAGGKKGGAGTKALHQLQAEHAAVKVESAFDVCDFEVHMANADLGIDDEGRIVRLRLSHEMAFLVWARRWREKETYEQNLKIAQRRRDR